MMHKRTLTKPDGRALYLYGWNPISAEITATNPEHEPVKSNPHLRWHPLRGEWVIYASHRQNRTFLPPKDYSPLATTKSKEFPTEMPSGNYEAAVFENLFPSLTDAAHTPPKLFEKSAPAKGVCEVLVFTQDPESSLAELPLERVHLILEILADRTREHMKKKSVKYLLAFENRGVEMGVTLHHPHGQLYGYSFIPPVPARTLELMKRFYDENRSGLLATQIKNERADKRRLICETDDTIAFIPECARYPYETWIAPLRPAARLPDLSSAELKDLALNLKTVLQKMDGLWNRPMPYLMSLFQAPLDDESHPEAHLHFQITPAYRSKDRMKYLAGTELAGGIFVNDSLPEEKAAELRAVKLTEHSYGD